MIHTYMVIYSFSSLLSHIISYTRLYNDIHVVLRTCITITIQQHDTAHCTVAIIATGVDPGVIT